MPIMLPPATSDSDCSASRHARSAGGTKDARRTFFGDHAAGHKGTYGNGCSPSFFIGTLAFFFAGSIRPPDGGGDPHEHRLSNSSRRKRLSQRGQTISFAKVMALKPSLFERSKLGSHYQFINSIAVQRRHVSS